MPKPTPWTQIVKANKTAAETFSVALAACAVIAIAFLVMHFNQIKIEKSHDLSEYEVSLRYDLKPSEQGIFSDLLLVYQDWQIMGGITAPTVADLIADDWPPFTDVLLQKHRGSHTWEKQDSHGTTYYLGLSENIGMSGHFLWILPAQSDSKNRINVWLNSTSRLPRVSHVHESDLPTAGWKKINPTATINPNHSTKTQ